MAYRTEWGLGGTIGLIIFDGASDYTNLGNNSEWERRYMKQARRKQKRIRVKAERRQRNRRHPLTPTRAVDVWRKDMRCNIAHVT